LVPEQPLKIFSMKSLRSTREINTKVRNHTCLLVVSSKMPLPNRLL
jgi:hypothetical protein